MAFFFPSSPSTSDATVSSLTSSPRVGGVDELVTPTHVSSGSPRSPITATSTTRAPESELASPKIVKLHNSNDIQNNNRSYEYGDDDRDGSVLHPLSRAASDAYEHHGSSTHRRRDHDRDRAGGLGVSLEKSFDRLIRLVTGESSDSESSFDDGMSSARSRRSPSRKGKSREGVVEDASSSSRRIHHDHDRAIGGDEHDRDRAVDTNLTVPAAYAGSSVLQGSGMPRSSMRVPASPPPIPIPPPVDEEGRARARSQRRRSSGEPSRLYSTRTHSRRSSRRLVVHKRQEVGVSRDFVLIVALCVGFACAIVLMARPAMMVLVQRGGSWDLE